MHPAPLRRPGCASTSGARRPTRRTSTRAPSWYPSAWTYKDLYAIYATGDGEVKPDQHAEWILRDAQGHKLYIRYDCSAAPAPSSRATSATPPSAHTGSPTPSACTIAHGYQGLFVDDVNMELRISDGHGNLQCADRPAHRHADERGRLAPLHGRVHGADPRRELAGRRDRPQPALVQRRHRPVHPPRPGRRRPDRDSSAASTTPAWRRRGPLSCARCFKQIDRLHARGKGVILDAYADSQDGRHVRPRRLLPDRHRPRRAAATTTAGTPEDWWSRLRHRPRRRPNGPRYDLPTASSDATSPPATRSSTRPVSRPAR